MSKGDKSQFLSKIRQNFSGRYTVKALVAVIVFGMIIAVFVLSDLSGRAGGKGSTLGGGAAATVNGEIISLKQFQDQEARISNYYSQLLGGKIEGDFQRRQILNETMSQLVDGEVAYQAARKEKIYATDADLRKAILEVPAFRKDGVFQSDLYKAVLNANRLTTAEFEDSLRQQVSLQKVRGLFESSSQPMQLEKQLENDLKSKKMEVAFLKLDAQTFNSAKLISDADVQASLAKDDFKAKVQDYHTKNKAEFETPEKIKAAHILVRGNPQDAADMEKAKVKADGIFAQTAKVDFGKLAAQNSDDPGSKTKNGDLGYFSRGQMVKEFEDVAFNLKKGEVSAPVKTQFGYHIIKLMDKTPALTAPEAQAFTSIGRKLLAEEKYTAVAKEIEKALADNNTQLVESILAQHKLAWTNSGYFDLGAEVVPQANSSALFKASIDLNAKAPYAKNLVREGDAQYVLKLKDKKTNAIAGQDGRQTELLNKQKSFSQYQQWVDFHKRKASIETNNQLLQ